jgi:hypothetical protein
VPTVLCVRLPALVNKPVHRGKEHFSQVLVSKTGACVFYFLLGLGGTVDLRKRGQMEQTIEPANIAGKLGLADIVKHAHERDAEFVGAYFEQHWSFISGNSAAMASLMREMKRRFKLRDRKKQLDGTSRSKASHGMERFCKR